MNTDSPCKGCTERHAGCHAHCERYQAWSAHNEQRREAERKRKQAYYDTFPVRLAKHLAKKK